MLKKILNNLIIEKGINKATLAEQTNIPLTTICNWYIRESYPTADKLIKLANYFEVSTDYLLGRESDIGVVEVNKDLTPYQKELIYITNKLNDFDKREVVGFAKSFIK